MKPRRTVVLLCAGFAALAGSALLVASEKKPSGIVATPTTPWGPSTPRNPGTRPGSATLDGGKTRP